MKRKNIIGKTKFLYFDEKRRLEKSPVLKKSLKDLSKPIGFIQLNYITSNNSSYLSVLRSDSNDLPNWLNIDEYKILGSVNFSDRDTLIGPYTSMMHHHTTPKKLKKINPCIIISA